MSLYDELIGKRQRPCGKGEELNGPRWSVQLNGWIARLAFAMGDSSHVDDEREGGPSGESTSGKGTRVRARGLGMRTKMNSARDRQRLIALPPRKGKPGCPATLTLRQREQLAAHLTHSRLGSWLSLNHSASSASPPSSPYHYTISAVLASPLSAYPSPRAALYVAHATSI